MASQFDEYLEGVNRDLISTVWQILVDRSDMSAAERDDWTDVFADKWTAKLAEMMDKAYEMGFLDGHSEGVEDGVAGGF